ncbi:MAG: TolC family protein [Sulfuricurvum sp.]|uniref:TolC family protein n=1 Tax=Sulfuricurvum sp. TaxID=2025608 RepID=UPI00262F19EE|nr:TolC family protein [Sulfuricurvum sp.]MDD5160779.1 TolC family protein [Sulfuricurvum sp.]
MKRKTLLFSLALMSSTLTADTIHEWLDAAHKAPNQQLSDLALSSAELLSDAATAALYPKISLIGSIEHFNAPTSLRPVPPTEISSIGASGGGYPFVQTMTSAGATVSMPLFVKTLLTNTEKARQNVTSQEFKRRISIAERDATLIASNARLGYLENLTLALEAKERSLASTRESLLIKTRNGRAAEIELTKVDEQINQTRLKLQETQNARLDAQKTIAILIDKPITHSVAMHLSQEFDDQEYLAVSAKEQEVKVANLAAQSAKESLYPALSMNGSYFHRAGDAYNNGDSISRDYGNIALNLTMPLFDKERLTSIELSRLEEQKAHATLQQTKLESDNTYSALRNQYATLKQSRTLAVQSVANYEAMLVTAKVAYATERMVQEEYLRYEEALFNAKAALYAIDATLWQNIAQRAALSGKDFKEIVQ